MLTFPRVSFPPLKIFDQEGTSSSFAETELFMTFFDVTTFYFENYFFHYLVSYKLFLSSEKQTFMCKMQFHRFLIVNNS